MAKGVFAEYCSTLKSSEFAVDMPTGRPLDPALRSQIVRLISTWWTDQAIAKELHVGLTSVSRIHRNLRMYGSPTKPQLRPRGCPRKITIAGEESLLEFLRRQPWAQLDEMVWFLWEDQGIHTHNSTVCRVLKRRRMSSKKARRVSRRQSLELRNAWRAQMASLHAEQLVFLDESTFNEATGNRGMAWAPIGEPARWHDDTDRGRSWSVLPAYTTDGYLPCTGVRFGHYNIESFLEWLDELLPHCQPYPKPRSVIVMDNVSLHCNPAIEQKIQAAGCLVRYLPPYSPDYNPIEMSFSVLKAWVRRHFRTIRPRFLEFGQFLRTAIKLSRCDRFPEKHFRSDEYIYEGDIEKFEEELWHGDWIEQVPVDQIEM